MAVELTDLSEIPLGPFSVIEYMGYWVIAAKDDSTGKHYYLFGDFKIHDNVNGHGMWTDKHGAQVNLDRWLESQKPPAAACTCPSIDLFNRGCTCGFLKRKP